MTSFKSVKVGGIILNENSKTETKAKTVKKTDTASSNPLKAPISNPIQKDVGIVERLNTLNKNKTTNRLYGGYVNNPSATSKNIFLPPRFFTSFSTNVNIAAAIPPRRASG